jgi:hypothetical protein
MAVQIKTNIAKLMKKLTVKEDGQETKPAGQKNKKTSKNKKSLEEESFDSEIDDD